ncbi:hypothetical protein [Syntrophus aciditrophicus]|uniref:hypothetical protein n=1 Tax=Syntrophus aciditrophicus TaxID=316277 RepID=UPI001F26A566|nr:hypothetical protein [Syntrophus aciditrophicus]
MGIVTPCLFEKKKRVLKIFLFMTVNAGRLPSHIGFGSRVSCLFKTTARLLPASQFIISNAKKDMNVPYFIHCVNDNGAEIFRMFLIQGDEVLVFSAMVNQRRPLGLVIVDSYQDEV